FSPLVVKNGSKIFSCSASGMPAPVSLTDRHARSPVLHVRTRSWPPLGIAATALKTRVVITSRSSHGVPSTLAPLRPSTLTSTPAPPPRCRVLPRPWRRRRAGAGGRRHRRGPALPREALPPPHHLRRVVGAGPRRLQVAADVRVQQPARQRQVQKAQHAAQRVVELVRHAAGHLAQRPHLPRLDQPVLRVPQVLVGPP